MAFRTNPAPELLTFEQWFTPVESAPDGSGLPSATYSEMQPSNIRTRPASGGVEVANIDLTVTVVRRRSWIVMARATRALLEHERIHYLIAICVGRNLHEDAFNTSASSTSALQTTLSALRTEAAQSVQQLSDRYDRDTNHGAITSQQTVWAARVNRWYTTGFKEW
jgi:uncharacterized protein DUF922